VAAIKLDGGAEGARARRAGSGGRLLPARARGPGAAAHHRARQRAPRRQHGGARLPRDHVRLPGAGKAAAGGLSSAPRAPSRRPRRLKHFGHAAVCVPQVTIDTRVRRGRVRATAITASSRWRIPPRAWSAIPWTFIDSPLKIAGEVEMRISHHLLVAPGTRCEAGDADLRAPAGAGAVPQLAGYALARTVERLAVSSNGEAARIAADTGLSPPSPATWPPRPTISTGSPSILRTPPDNTTRFSGDRSQRGAAERARQDLDRRVQPQQARCAVYTARSVPAPRRQPDAHRYAALAHREMGLRFLHRVRGTPAGPGVRSRSCASSRSSRFCSSPWAPIPGRSCEHVAMLHRGRAWVSPAWADRRSLALALRE
jgi:hypothetical protein